MPFLEGFVEFGCDFGRAGERIVQDRGPKFVRLTQQRGLVGSLRTSESREQQ